MLLQWISGLGLLAIAAAALGLAVYEIRRRHRDNGFHAEMLDALDDRVCRFRVDDLVITYCNDAWAHSMGTTPSAVTGRPLGAFVPVEAVEGVRALLDERGADDGESRRETKLRHVDGRVVYEQWWDRVVVSADGHRELLCVGRDVTERALVENRLADSERQHRELIERLPLAAFVRRDRGLVFANQAAADLVGLDEPSQLLDMTLDSLFTPDGLDVLEDRIARRVAGQPVDPIVRAHGPHHRRRDPHGRHLHRSDRARRRGLHPGRGQRRHRPGRRHLGAQPQRGALPGPGRPLHRRDLPGRSPGASPRSST